MINREIHKKITLALNHDRSVLLLGARQTGKTTLAETFDIDLTLSLVNLSQTLHYQKNTDQLIPEITQLNQKLKHKPLVFIDEIQKIPLLFDAVQYLIDNNIAQFILTGSSARKIRQQKNINLLPGRLLIYHMDPLTISELENQGQTLASTFAFGTLPNIVCTENETLRHEDLKSYATLYLEEEIRGEALVKDITHFSRFIELAAESSGNITNFSKLSQEIGISHNTIKAYYQILVDCLMAFEIPAYTHSSVRRSLVKSSRHIFFDLGVRRYCAKEGAPFSTEKQGRLFEQFVGLELIRFRHISDKIYEVYYWRDHNGKEVDYLIKHENTLIPVEVKLTSSPKASMMRHLNTFIDEYEQAEQGFIICDCPLPMRMSDTVTALPWRSITEVFSILNKT